MSHDDLRALAAAATPGPWHLESHLDMLDPPATWHIADLERWRGYTNNVGFGEDEATARYVAAVSPDVVLGLLDEIGRLRDRPEPLWRLYDKTVLDEVREIIIEHGRMSPGVRQIADLLGVAGPPEPSGEGSTTVTAGDMAVELPAPPDVIVDLMDALERSMADAKDARTRHPQPTREDG